MECPTAVQATRPLRVVIVDDVADVRLLLRVQFDFDERFDVVGEGADGEDAIRLARELQPDLLVLDRNMPRLGGIEAIEGVREAAPDTAVVLYTAVADAAVYHAALAAGALDVLDKAAGPQFVDELTTKLLDRTGDAGSTVEVRVGPVSGAAARVWIANSTKILDAVVAHPGEVFVPADALDLFRSLLAEWEQAASGAEEFVWVARVERSEISRIVEQWAVLDAMDDEQLHRLGVHWSPPEGTPFFEALTTGVLQALERHEETRRLAARLGRKWAADLEGGSAA